MDTKFNEIVEALKKKACLKQKIYRNTLEVFNQAKVIASELSNALSGELEGVDSDVVIHYEEINEFEFRLKFSGDMLIFTMHSNIIAFPETHILAQSPYIKQNIERGYFGHIMVYNFMADSIKYNRLNDPGYLLGRLLLNVEKHFYVEGVRQLNFLYPDISENKINKGFLLSFVESAMLAAINNDLLAPSYQDIEVIQLGYKFANQMVSGGQKVGFQMNWLEEGK